jgi:ribosomal protein S18 acetylase RimI-like enzyme
MVEYEPLSMSHYDAVVALWTVTEGVGITVGDTREGLERYLARNEGLSWIAMEEGVLVGTVLCGHDGRRGYLYHLAVRRAARGRGIGRELVRRGLDGLEAADILRCVLMVKAENAAAMGFWERGGWNRRGELMMYSRAVER